MSELVIFHCSNQNPPQSLFPGGYKRPEIKVPNIVLRLSSDDVFRDDRAILDAVSGRVGIVLLTGGEGSGEKLYEAACLLKSVIRDRAYLLIDERVDIAAAAFSDQGLPTIVARNTMMDAKTDSVILPLVARNVQTHDAAINEDARLEYQVTSVFECVRIPVFLMVDSLRSGVSGLVVSVDELNLLSEDDLNKLFYCAYASNKKVDDVGQSFDNIRNNDTENGFYGEKMISELTILEEIDFG